MQQNGPYIQTSSEDVNDTVGTYRSNTSQRPENTSIGQIYHLEVLRQQRSNSGSAFLLTKYRTVLMVNPYL